MKFAFINNPLQNNILETLPFRSTEVFVCIFGLLIFHSIMFIFNVYFIFWLFHVSIPVQICLVLFCFVIHFALFHVRICTLVYINTQWCQREGIWDWKLEMCHSDSWLLTAVNLLKWVILIFFPLNLSLFELTHSHGDGSILAEQCFLTADTKQETCSLSQLCGFVRIWACVLCPRAGPHGTGSWWPQLGSQSMDHSPDDGFQQPWLPPCWCWKGDEGPNREGYDFETIFLKK